MPLTYRFGEVRRILGSYLAPASGYAVNVYEPGAVASQASSGTTITVHAGHGIAASDKIVVGTDLTTYRSVSSVTATTVVVGSAVGVASGDVILNLGPNDTGTPSPNWDGSGRAIYSDPTGTTQIARSELTTNAEGEWEYWTRSRDCWEVIRSGSSILEIVKGLPLPSEQIIRWAHEYATGGLGTHASPWTGWAAAITGASTGDEVRFVNAQFAVPLGGITIPSGVALVGATKGYSNSFGTKGTIIRPVAGFTGAMLRTATDSFNVLIENMLVDGSQAANTPIATNGIVIDGCWNATVRNVDMRLFLGSAVKATKSAGTTSNAVLILSRMYIQSACRGTGLGTYTGAIHLEYCPEPFLEKIIANCTVLDDNYDEGGNRVGIYFGPTTSHPMCIGTGSEYAETGVVLRNIGGGQWIGGGCGDSNGHGMYIDTSGWNFVGALSRDASGAANNTYDSYHLTANAVWTTMTNCRADHISGNQPRYGFNDNGGTGGVNRFFNCLALGHATAEYVNNHAYREWSIWLGERLGTTGAYRFVLGSNHVGIGLGVDENIKLTFDGSTGDGTIEFRADQGAGVSRRFGVTANLTAQTLQAYGDTGGIANETSITSGNDLSANSSGVGTVLFKGTTSRNSTGFIKVYIGTTAYYVPVFSAITG